MNVHVVAMGLVAGAILRTALSTAAAAPCLIVTLTGTHGGPQQSFNGLASAGTLVRYGDDADNCGAVTLQFDAGRGTTMRLSQLGVGSERLNAVFFTHMNNDHTDGFADLVQSRWAFHGTGPKIDAVCSSDVVSPQGITLSCKKFVTHMADAFIESGEIAQRHSEVKERTAGGPAELVNTITFEPKDEPQLVWSSGDVRVSAIRSTHIAGHVSYRADTPAGSVVIGGDAGNDVLAPPRNSSTSEQVERLAKGADIIVHSTIHPIMGPGKGSGMFPCVLSPKHGARSGRHGAAGRREASHADTSHPAHRSRRAISLQGSGQPADGGGLQKGGSRRRLYRRYHCWD
jgi:ribonuclease Z